MARSLRIEYPGAIYHVTSRMVGSWRDERARLFRDDHDRRRFLEQLDERVEGCDIRLFQFCLMANHLHLVFETPRANCSDFMHALLTAYTVYFNRRHRRHGHLVDGRFKDKLVEGDDYLLALSRYVHLNPVEIKSMQKLPVSDRRKALRTFKWSSYPGYIGKGKPWPFVSSAPVLAMMPGRAGERSRRYRKFVETGLMETDEEFEALMNESPRSIGGEAFRRWVEELHEKQLATRGSREDVAFRQTTEPLDPDVVLAVVADECGVEVEVFRERRRDSILRAVAIKNLMRFSGMSQRKVAAFLEVGSGSAVSKQLSRFAASSKKRPQVKKQLRRIERRLLELRKEGRPSR
jgi:REP element-mobilizing transposase RayT